MNAVDLAGWSARLRLPETIGFVAETGSTNADLKALGALAPHGTALVADHQTAGRGRLGRRWVSPPGGNVYLSVVLRPKLPVARIPLLCLGTAVAVAEVCGPIYRIKWPNDVQAPDGRKVAGILAELESIGGRADAVVVGVGLNLSAAPPLPTATTLLATDGQARDRAELAARLVKGILDAAAAVAADPSAVLDRWRARSATLGARVQVGAVRGRAVDVDADGALMVVDDQGVAKRILAGDVEMIG